MKKSLFTLAINIFLAILGLLQISLSNDSNKQIVIYCTLVVLIIILMELLKKINTFIEKNNIIISLLEAGIILLSINVYNLKIGLYLVPMVVLNIIGYKLNVYLSVGIVIVISMFLNGKDEIINLVIYNFLVTMYLYNIESDYNSKQELKLLNKDLRESEGIMKKKMINLDKYLEQNVIITTLKERNYIAQKLHDKLGHRIAGSIMQLEVAKEIMDSDAQTSKDFLNNSINNLREGMEEIRDFLHNVKPEEKIISLEDLNEIIVKFQCVSGISCRFNVEGEINRLPSMIIEVFKDNIKEALTNAAKYSKATKIEINLYIYNKIARLEIRDNGIGATLNKENMGIGLKGMIERAKVINGNIDFYNDNGFVISMLVGV